MLEGVIKTKEKNNGKITQHYKTNLICDNYGRERNKRNQNHDFTEQD
jgi:hypothetical protein